MHINVYWEKIQHFLWSGWHIGNDWLHFFQQQQHRRKKDGMMNIPYQYFIQVIVSCLIFIYFLSRANFFSSRFWDERKKILSTFLSYFIIIKVSQVALLEKLESWQSSFFTWNFFLRKIAFVLFWRKALSIFCKKVNI